MNKKILIVIFAICGFLFSSIVIAAPITQAEKAAAANALLAKQKTKAIAEIDRRVSALNNTIIKINTIQKITADQKTALATQAQAEITSLQQLEEKINNTDKGVLLTDRKAIVQQYRIFALFEPKVAIIVYADKILNVADLMDAKTTDADIKAKIADAKVKAQKAITDVTALKPEGYPGNKNVLTASRDLLTSARQELNEARVSMKQATPSSSVNPQ
jgi:hypothetical protein